VAGLEPNRPVVAVQSQTACGFPGPVANTKGVVVDPVRTLFVLDRNPKKRCKDEIKKITSESDSVSRSYPPDPCSNDGHLRSSYLSVGLC